MDVGLWYTNTKCNATATNRAPRDAMQHGASHSLIPQAYEHSLSTSYQGHFITFPPESPHHMGLAHLLRANSNPRHMGPVSHPHQLQQLLSKTPAQSYSTAPTARTCSGNKQASEMVKRQNPTKKVLVTQALVPIMAQVKLGIPCLLPDTLPLGCSWR